MRKLGSRVKILGGMQEFIGQTGTIIDNSDRDFKTILYRVKLDKPVWVESVGYKVTDDLWSGELLKTIKL